MVEAATRCEAQRKLLVSGFRAQLMADLMIAAHCSPFVEGALGWAGSTTALMLFLAPLVTVRAILRDKTVGEYSPTPYVVSAMNCALWSVYGLAHLASEAQVIATNGPGLLLEVGYVGVFVAHETTPAARAALRARAAAALGATAAFCGACFALARGRADAAASAVGWGAVVLNVLMYGAPLDQLAKVVRERSVRSMPLGLSLCTLATATCWSGFALCARDAHIFLPNALGVALGVAQLALYARYYDRAHFKARRTAESERSVGGDGAMARLCEPLDPAASPDS